MVVCAFVVYIYIRTSKRVLLRLYANNISGIFKWYTWYNSSLLYTYLLAVVIPDDYCDMAEKCNKHNHHTNTTTKHILSVHNNNPTVLSITLLHLNRWFLFFFLICKWFCWFIWFNFFVCAFGWLPKNVPEILWKQKINDEIYSTTISWFFLLLLLVIMLLPRPRKTDR